jgi:thioredoxin-related protein
LPFAPRALVCPVKSRYGNSILTALLAIAFLFAGSQCTQKEPNYLTALGRAKSENKLLLLDFTGSDWCIGCMKLEKKVFSTTTFKDYAEKNLVMMKVDFPQNKKQSKAVEEQNEELARRYGVEGFPTIVIVNTEGKALGQFMYREGGPEEVIAEIEKFRAKS